MMSYYECMADCHRIMRLAEHLADLDPPGGYAQANVIRVSDALGADGCAWYSSDQASIERGSTSEPYELRADVRFQDEHFGTLTLCWAEPPTKAIQETFAWVARVFGKGMFYHRRALNRVERKEASIEDTVNRAPLTPRERDVVTLLVSGSNTREIAEQTALTVSTINTYLKRIFSKLGVHSRVELIARMAGTTEFASGTYRRGENLSRRRRASNE
ncbi:MAG: LuxR C-terminal-related transcriptional regulator [Polyangiales bacterium]